MLRSGTLELRGRRVMLRPLVAADWEQWREVRKRGAEWLLKWEPAPLAGQPDPADDRRVFSARCGARDRERQLGTGYGFGIFLRDRFVGELNLSGVQRGPFQNGYVGYWIDESVAGLGYTPEACAVLFRYAFEELHLHRLQISIIPRNLASNRVAQKLGLRDEGIAVRYLEINGDWEDHIRYAITSEDWWAERKQMMESFLV